MSTKLRGNKIKSEKISLLNRIILGVVFINLVATVFVIFRPKLEEKLFSLYTASVAGLYGGLTIQSLLTGQLQQNESGELENRDDFVFEERPLQHERSNNDESSEFGNF